MTAPRDNPAGLGPRDRDGSGTGSVEDTSYDAEGSDRYVTGEPEKDFSDLDERPSGDQAAGPSRPADPSTTSSDEP